MQVITPAEAARRLGKHRSTVYRMIERGEVRIEPIVVAETGVCWDEQKGDLVKPE